MKKRDIFIIGVVLVIALIGIFFINANKEPEAKTKLQVSSQGKIVKEVELTPFTSETILVETELGMNKIRIENGKIEIYEADCPDQICVHTAPIDEIGEMIICLPHQVIAEVISLN